jgi:hypothetical protein
MKYQPPYGSPGADDPYINGDPSIGQQGSIPPAASIEYPQREIVNLIKASSLVPDDADLKQLTRGVRSQGVNFCIDTGAANALQTMLDPSLTAYRQGLPLRVLVAHNNTGPSTINVNSLGNRPIKRGSGSQLEANDMRAGQVAVLVDDGTSFQLTNYLGAVASTVNNYTVDIPYAQDTGAANAMVGNFAPAVTSWVTGDLFLIRVASKNTGPVTLKVGANTPYYVMRNDGTHLQSQDLVANEILLLNWNVSYFQVMRMVRSQVYMKLTADLTLYVRTDGNDANDGSANTAASAFRTVQAAVTYVANSFLIGGRTVTIQLGTPGTYQGQVVIQNMPGSVVIRGDPANMLSYLLLGPTLSNNPVFPQSSSYPVTVSVSGSGANVTLSGLSVAGQASASNIIECHDQASLGISDIAFTGIPMGIGIAVFGGSVVTGNYIHWYSNIGNCVVCFGGSFVAPLYFHLWNMHGISFDGAFCQAYDGGLISMSYGWMTFTGSAYGKRYNAAFNSIIKVGGGGSDFLPGNIPGSIDASSVYA